MKSVLLDQPTLMSKLGATTQELIREVVEKQKQEFVGADLLLEGSLFWRAFCEALGNTGSFNPHWISVYYEDLASNPRNGFQKLCERLDLPYCVEIENAIKATAMVEDMAKLDNVSHVKRYRSAENVAPWRNVLTEEQFSSIKNITQPIAGHFYQMSWDEFQ